MKKLFGAIIVLISLTIGVLLFGQTTASAHTPGAFITCTSWQLTANSYDTEQGNPTPNTLSYRIDGSPQVNIPFGSGTEAHGSFPANSGNHSLTAQFTAFNDPDGSKGWTKSYSLTSQGCTAPPASTVTVTAPPVVTTVTVSAPPVTATVTNSSTETVTAPPVTSTVTAPGSTVTNTESVTGSPVTATETVSGTSTVTGPGTTVVSTATTTATATVIQRQTIIKNGSSTKTQISNVTIPVSHVSSTSSSRLASTGTHTGLMLALAAGLIGGGILLTRWGNRRHNH